MGYVSASRSSTIGSVEAARVRSVLVESLSLSSSPSDPEISALLGMALKRTTANMGVVGGGGFSSSSSDGRQRAGVVATCHRSLHDAAVYRGAASSADIPHQPAGTLPALVKTMSLESVSSTSSAGSSIMSRASSSAASACPSSPNRSIFGRYWTVKKERKIQFVPESSGSSSISAAPPLTLDEVHETREHQAFPPSSPAVSSSSPVSPISPKKRRSIFTPATPSPSTLDLVSQLSQQSRLPLIKASSTSILLTRRRSCLRSVRRYSSVVGNGGGVDPRSKSLCIRPSTTSSTPTCGTDAAIRRVRSSSVSFSPQVDVVEFQKACEFHAEEGWSDHFH